MLCTIPFTSDGVLYIILFGAERSFRDTLGILDVPPRVVFLHLTDLMPDRLAATAINKVAHIAFGPAHCFVRPTGRGTRPAYLTTKFCGNYLATMSDAATCYMVFHPFEESNFQIMLGAVLGELIRYAGWNDQAQNLPRAHECTNDLESQLDPHLHSQRLTYSELVMLLHKAAEKRRDEFHSTHEVLPSNSPIHCFETPHQLILWLTEKMEGRNCGTTHSGAIPNIGSPGPASAKNSPTADTIPEGRALVSKKRKLDWDYVSTSFYNPDQDTEEA